MDLIPPSYAEIYEKKKLFEGNFPLAEIGVKWFAFTYRLVKWYLFFSLSLFPFSSYFYAPIRDVFLFGRDWLVNGYLALTGYASGGIQNFLEGLYKAWLSRFTLLAYAILVSFVVYLVYVVRRQRLYEREVIKNDYLSYRARKKVMQDFDIKGRLDDIESMIANEKSADNTSRVAIKANLIELKKTRGALEELRRTRIIYNTRETLGHKVRRTVTIFFYSPTSYVEKEKFDELKEPFIETAQVVLQQFFSDERERDDGVRGDSFVQAVISEEADKYYYGDKLNELEKLYTTSHYFHSSPHNDYEYNGKVYSGLSNKQIINEERYKNAKKWANTLTDEVLAVLRQNGYNASFSHLSIESRTAELFYNLPKNFKKNEAGSLKGMEEVIQEQVNSSNRPTITLGIDKIRVSLALPNGKDKNGNDTDNFVQLLDTEKILRRNFG